MNRRYEDGARLELERAHRHTLSDDDWRQVLAESGVDASLALDDQDIEALEAAFKASPSFQKVLQSDIARARALLGVDDGPGIHAGAYMALRKLRALSVPATDHPPIDVVDAADLGRLLLLLLAAQRVAQVRSLSPLETLFALLAAPDGRPFEPLPDDHSAMTFLRDFAADAAQTSYRFAFPDDRRRPLIEDVQLAEAVWEIARPDKRQHTPSAEARWRGWHRAYEAHYAVKAGRTFTDADQPWKAFREAFRKARKRLIAQMDGWEFLTAVK